MSRVGKVVAAGIFAAALTQTTMQAYAQAFEPTIDRCLNVTDFSPVCVEAGVDAVTDGCTSLKNTATAACNAYLERWDIKLRLAASDWSSNFATEIIALIFFVLSAVLALVVRHMKDLVGRLKSRLGDPFIKRPPRYEATGLNILLVGEGGVGKTSLIRAASGSPYANPDISTKELVTYSIANEVTIKKADNQETRNIARLYIDDYVGQDITTFLGSDYFTSGRGQKIKTMLVIVVDLFPPDGVIDGEALYEDIDIDRIEKNIGAYNDNMIRILTSKLSGGSAIVLFINKIDKLKKITPGTIKEALKAYELLIRNLERVRGAAFHVIVGSARNGMGVVSGDVGQKSLYSLAVEAAGSNLGWTEMTKNSRERQDADFWIGSRPEAQPAVEHEKMLVRMRLMLASLSVFTVVVTAVLLLYLLSARNPDALLTQLQEENVNLARENASLAAESHDLSAALTSVTAAIGELEAACSALPELSRTAKELCSSSSLLFELARKTPQ